MSNYHKPVLLQEVLEFLDVKQDKLYIDATLGGGGHALAIAKEGGRVLGMDVDEEAIEFVKNELRSKNHELRIEERIKIAKGNFRNIDSIADEFGFTQVSGILFDLGVSSFQLDRAERGFSFNKAGPLDMRMDRDLQVKAMDLVNGLTKKELYELFTKYGQEPFALALSKSIDESRRVKPIATTRDLSEIVERTIKGKYELNKSTRVFQALRIAVNDELNAISEALPKAFELLESDGRLVVISFHSLEDRIVKNFFKEESVKGQGEILTDKPVVASSTQVEQNKRSRSAKLRAIRKL